MNSPSSRPDSRTESLVSAIKGGAQKVALPAALALASTFSANVAQAQIEPETFAGVRGVECEGDCSILIDQSNPTNATVYATPGHVADVKIQCPLGFVLNPENIHASLPKDFAEKGKVGKMYDAPRAGTTGMNFLPVSFPNVNMPLSDDPTSQQRAVITGQCTGEGADAVDYEIGVVSTKDVPAYGRGAGMESTGAVVTGGSRRGKFKNLLVGADAIVTLEHANGDDVDSSWHNGVGGRLSLMYKLNNLIEGGVVGASMVILNQPDAVDTETNGKANITRLITAGCLDVGYLGDGFEAITGGCVAAASGPKFTNKETDEREKADPIPVDADVIGAVEAKIGATFGISDGLKGGIGAFGILNIEHDGATAAGVYFGVRSK